MLKILNSAMIMILVVLSPLTAIKALAAPADVTFTVNSTLDQPDDLTIPGTCHTAVGTCTLRAAIMQADRTSGAGATILLPAGLYGLTIPASGTDGEENGDLNLTTPAFTNPLIAIQGAGASTTIIDANQLDRVFFIDIGRTATISGVTIRGGYAAASDGGGIFNSGTLTLSDSLITGNSAGSLGGGIANAFTLTINNSIISVNQAANTGGGIDNQNSLTINKSTISLNNAVYGAGIETIGALSVINSTISLNKSASYGGGILNYGSVEMSGSTVYGNSATDGGGIFNENILTMWNSTLSQNTAKDSGGGIYNANGPANVYNVSIVGNGADTDIVGGSAGGVYNGNLGTFNMRNTLVAGNNVSNSPQYDDCTGTLNSYGRNLFWSVIGCTVTNGVGGAWYNLNALNTLGPLQDNGGPTWTVELLPGSNAIDGGDPIFGCIDYAAKPLTTDQRGFPRVVGSVCDVGAFEYSPLSSNANLSMLALSRGSLTPVFAAGTTAYTASIANSVTSLTVTPSLADLSASIKVNGASVASGSASGAISLNVGANTITVVVTAQNGTKTISYTVTVTRDASNFLAYLPITIK